MKKTYDFLAGMLRKRDIRLSTRRLKILEYLCQNRNHPTADQIFANIQKDMPQLSRTTVYNTLHLLHDAGLVRVISMDGSEARYDITLEPHGHFRCDACGAVCDFETDLTRITPDALTGYEITEKNVYFKGICPICLSK